MSNRELIAEMGYEDSIVFENPDYDDAIIGVTDDGNVVYDYELMVEHLIANHGMDYEEAVDFISYNSSVGLADRPCPVIMYKLLE